MLQVEPVSLSAGDVKSTAGVPFFGNHLLMGFAARRVLMSIVAAGRISDTT